MLSHTKCQIGINIFYMKFFQCVQIERHSSSLTNLGNSTRNFRQFVQICCGEEEREKEVGDDLRVSALNLEFV